MEPLSVGIVEAARLVGVSRQSLYRLVRAKRLRSVKVGGRRLFAVSDLRALVDARPDPTAINTGRPTSGA